MLGEKILSVQNCSLLVYNQTALLLDILILFPSAGNECQIREKIALTDIKDLYGLGHISLLSLGLGLGRLLCKMKEPWELMIGLLFSSKTNMKALFGIAWVILDSKTD